MQFGVFLENLSTPFHTDDTLSLGHGKEDLWESATCMVCSHRRTNRHSIGNDASSESNRIPWNSWDRYHRHHLGHSDNQGCQMGDVHQKQRGWKKVVPTDIKRQKQQRMKQKTTTKNKTKNKKNDRKYG